MDKFDEKSFLEAVKVLENPLDVDARLLEIFLSSSTEECYTRPYA